MASDSEILSDVYDSTNHVLKTSGSVATGDIEIGAVEIKDGTDDVRASVSPANTARTTATNVIEIQEIDEAGNVMGRTPANTARTTGTNVAPVQPVDPAGVAGSVSSALRTDLVYNAAVALTPKFAKISTSTSGASTVVAAVSSKKIRVLSYVITANTAVNAKFQSHVTPTDITGLEYFGTNGGVSAPFSPVGHFETVAGEALDINLSGAIAVGGHLTYVEV